MDGYIKFLMKYEKFTLNSNNKLILYVVNFDLKYMVKKNRTANEIMRPILNIYIKSKSNFWYELINRNIFNIKQNEA